MALMVMIPAGRKEVTVNGLHQWDYGQKLEIHDADLPALVKVHFACVGMEEAIVRVCSVENGVAEVAIPDRCLEQPTPITAWIYAEDESSGATTKTITLVITPRARPQPGDTPPEDFSDTCAELIAAVNAQVETLKAGTVTVSNAQRAESAHWADNALYAENAQNVTFASKATTADKATNATHAESADSADRAACDGQGNDIANTYAKKESLTAGLKSQKVAIDPEINLVGDMFYVGLPPKGKGLNHVCAVAFTLSSSNQAATYYHGFVQDIFERTSDGYMTLEVKCALIPFGSADGMSIGHATIKLVIVDGVLYFVLDGHRRVAFIGNPDGSVAFSTTSDETLAQLQPDYIEIFYR